MEFRILGPLEVVEDNRPVELGGAKQRALLTLLLLEANRVVSSDRLIDALWDTDPPDTAQKALQVHVSKLRKLLGRDRIVTRAPGYLIRVDPEELDLDRFERLAAEGGRQRLAEALALWRGPALGDLARTRFARPEIERLEARRLAVLEERIEADIALGRHADLVAELESLVAEHPLRERLRAHLMLALYRSGRQAEALEEYQEARRALVEELGIEPGRELRELHQTILRQDPGLELDRVSEPGPEVGDAAVGFVGRESELAQLTAGLDDAFAGRSRLFLLQGEPGIGKSRLAEELISRARARGAHALVGRCWEAGGAPAYWPWTQSLRAYLRAVEPGALRRQLGSAAPDVAQIVPELRELFPGLPEPQASESEAARFRLFDSTATFLRNASAGRPLVVALDDLHAADEPSLLLLRYVASAVDDGRILILGTFRDLDPTVRDPLETAVTELGRVPVTRRIRLSGLSRPEVARLAELTAKSAPDEQLVAALHAETEGNPLFVSEIVRLLAAEHLLEPEGARRIPIPETVREAIGRRLRHLSGECRRVLSLASVFGREFGLVALERVADYTGIDKLLGVLDEAITARVVEELSGGIGRLRFGHALTRDSLYEEIPATHRARLHRRVGEVLEELYAGNPDPHLAELAHHFSLAVPAVAAGKAVGYARRAADQAAAVLAYEEAGRLYALALRIIDETESPDDESRCALLLALGEVQMRAGDSPSAKETFLRGVEVARRGAMPQQLALAALGYGGRFVGARAGGDTKLVPLLEEALRLLGESDSPLRARLLARLTGALRDEPSRARREAISEEAAAIARRIDDAETLAYVLDGRIAAIYWPEDPNRRLAAADELLHVAEEASDKERVFDAHDYRNASFAQLGNVRAIDAELERMTVLAAELRQPAQRWLLLHSRTMRAVLDGRLADAETLIDETLLAGERAQPLSAGFSFQLATFVLRKEQGRLDEIESALQRSVGEYPSRRVFRCLLADLYSQLGRHDEARGAFDQLAAGGFGEIPLDPDWLLSMAFLCEVCTILGDGERAAELYELVLPFAGWNASLWVEISVGSVARYLGLLCTTMTRWEEGTRHFEDALEMNARMDARPWLAHTQEDYGRMLLERGAPGDVERARDLLDLARATYRELGMESYAARASSVAAGPAAHAP